MLARSLVGVLLALPAAVAIIGVFVTATPYWPELRVPALLMVFPVWLVLVWASYLLPDAKRAAIMLVALFAVGLAIINLLKYSGFSGL